MSDRVIHLLLGLAALSALVLAAAVWLRATRFLRRGSTAERFLDGALVICWLGVVFFFLLAGLGAFHIWTAAGVVLVTGLTALALTPRRDDQNQVASEGALRGPQLRDPWLWAALPAVVIALTRLVKSMASPPMTRDAMTVHLPKAAFWIQSASLSLPDFPDAWAYYRWFPAAGEVLFAWVMLPFRSDLLLGPFGILVWLAVLIAAARLARYLGADDRIAWLAGAALAALPTALVFMTANYVDNLMILFVLLAVTHAALFARTKAARNAILSLGASGLAIATKSSALVVIAPIVATIVVLVWRRRRQLHWSALSMMAAALMVPCAGYFHTWIHTGSPLYPFKAPLLSLPYHQGLADLFAGRVLLPEGESGALGAVVLKLFWSPPYGQGHMNFGLGGALLAAAAVAGIVGAVRKGERGTALWLTLAGAAVSTPLVFTDGNLALRTLWVGVLGRHLLPAFAPIALWAAAAPKPAARVALAASLLAGTVHHFQLGWSPAMVRPALQIATGLALCVAAVIALQRFTGKALGPRFRGGLAAVVGVLFLSFWTTIRARARYEIYRETTTGQGAFDAHPGHPAFAMGASLWPMLDTSRNLVIAVTVGKDQVGHNQFFYPLLGSRLQNRLVYVPISSSDDESRLEPAERYARAEPGAWLAHLEASSVDLVVGLWRPTPERDWLARQASFEVAALTNLGAPWIGRRRDKIEAAGPAPNPLLKRPSEPPPQ